MQAIGIDALRRAIVDGLGGSPHVGRVSTAAGDVLLGPVYAHEARALEGLLLIAGYNRSGSTLKRPAPDRRTSGAGRVLRRPAGDGVRGDLAAGRGPARRPARVEPLLRRTADAGELDLELPDPPGRRDPRPRNVHLTGPVEARVRGRIESGAYADMSGSASTMPRRTGRSRPRTSRRALRDSSTCTDRPPSPIVPSSPCPASRYSLDDGS